MEHPVLPIFFFCCRPADSVIVSFFFSTGKNRRHKSVLFCTIPSRPHQTSLAKRQLGRVKRRMGGKQPKWKRNTYFCQGKSSSSIENGTPTGREATATSQHQFHKTRQVWHGRTITVRRCHYNLDCCYPAPKNTNYIPEILKFYRSTQPCILYEHYIFMTIVHYANQVIFKI